MDIYRFDAGRDFFSAYTRSISLSIEVLLHSLGGISMVRFIKKESEVLKLLLLSVIFLGGIAVATYLYKQMSNDLLGYMFKSLYVVLFPLNLLELTFLIRIYAYFVEKKVSSSNKRVNNDIETLEGNLLRLKKIKNKKSKTIKIILFKTMEFIENKQYIFFISGCVSVVVAYLFFLIGLISSFEYAITLLIIMMIGYPIVLLPPYLLFELLIGFAEIEAQLDSRTLKHQNEIKELRRWSYLLK